jgi:RNA polymerase sigma-B factor
MRAYEYERTTQSGNTFPVTALNDAGSPVAAVLSTTLMDSRRRAERLMSETAASSERLAQLRASVATGLRSARGQYKILLDRYDRAIAEVSMPLPQGRQLSVPRRRSDVCDRTTWYFHVRYARRRDEAALAALVAHYQDDVDRQARRLGTRSSNDDLIQVAREALVVALHRFDPLRRKPFPPFARLTVDGTLRRYLRDQGYAIRPTRRIYELTPRVRHTSEWLTQELGRAPTANEIADALAVDADQVLEVIASAQTRSPLSLDRPLGEDGQTLADVAGHADVNLSRALDRQVIRQLMNSLSEEDRALLNEYFIEGHTQQDIADARGVSQMHVSRSLARILRRLRALANAA